MATQLRYLASSVSGTAANPDNALGNTATTFAGVTNANTSWSHVWAMALPTEPELAPVSQTFTVNARKGSNTGNPTMTINVQRPLGTTLATISATITSSTNSQGVSLAWTPPAGTPSSDPFYIEVVVTAAGGSPSARNSIEVSHAIWIAQTLMPAPKTGAGVGGVYAYTGSASGVTPAILPRAGDTAGAYGFTGSANGRLSARGIATGDYTWEGSASGTRAARGSAEGVWGFQGNADATAKMRGSASGSWGYSGGTAAGKRSPKGSVLSLIHI